MRNSTSLFLFLFSISSFAQDSLSVQLSDSLSVGTKSNPKGISDHNTTKTIQPALYFDYGKLFTLTSNYGAKYEGAFELIIKDKWQLITEVGHSKLTPQSAIENGDYLSQGTYVRLGLGFIPHIDTDSRFGLGVRYASSSFEDRGKYVIKSPSGLQPDIIEPINRKNLSAIWWEAVLYSDMALSNWLTLGFQFRVRFMQQYDSFDGVDVILIPGYGRAQDKSVPAVNLFLKFTPFH